MTNKTLKLPKGYSITEKSYGPSFNDGISIIHNYCNSCLKEKKCYASKTLRQAMGDNFPFWAKSFIFIDVPTEYKFEKSEVKVMCEKYKTKQQKLKLKIKGHDGVERLIELAEIEKQKYLAENPPENSSLSLEIETLKNM